MSATPKHPISTDADGAHSLHRLVRNRFGFYRECDQCKSVTWHDINPIGMWICTKCRRDNTPSERSSSRMSAAHKTPESADSVARHSLRAATGSDSHAAVMREGYKVPLIGIPADSVMETCDCCGDTVGLSDATFTGRQVLCRKCNTPNDKLSHGHPTTKKDTI